MLYRSCCALARFWEMWYSSPVIMLHAAVNHGFLCCSRGKHPEYHGLRTSVNCLSNSRNWGTFGSWCLLWIQPEAVCLLIDYRREKLKDYLDQLASLPASERQCVQSMHKSIRRKLECYFITRYKLQGYTFFYANCVEQGTASLIYGR